MRGDRRIVGPDEERAGDPDAFDRAAPRRAGAAPPDTARRRAVQAPSTCLARHQVARAISTASAAQPGCPEDLALQRLLLFARAAARAQGLGPRHVRAPQAEVRAVAGRQQVHVARRTASRETRRGGARCRISRSRLSKAPAVAGDDRRVDVVPDRLAEHDRRGSGGVRVRQKSTSNVNMSTPCSSSASGSPGPMSVRENPSAGRGVPVACAIAAAVTAMSPLRIPIRRIPRRSASEASASSISVTIGLRGPSAWLTRRASSRSAHSRSSRDGNRGVVVEREVQDVRDAVRGERGE